MTKDENLPHDVQGALDALADDWLNLDGLHGPDTRSLCCARLQRGGRVDGDMVFAAWFRNYPSLRGDLVELNLMGNDAPPSEVFLGFLNLYRKLMEDRLLANREADYTVSDDIGVNLTIPSVPSILSELVEIGRNHEHLLKQGAIAWAGEKARLLIQMLRSRVAAWIPAANGPQASEEIESLVNGFISRMEESLREAIKALFRHAAKHRKPAPNAKAEASPNARSVEASEGKGLAEEAEAKYQTKQEAVSWVRDQKPGSWIGPRMTAKAMGLKRDTIRRKRGLDRNEQGDYRRESILKFVDEKRPKRKAGRRRK